MKLSAKEWLDKIQALPLERKIKIMNVCGGHERSITMAGLRSALPKHIELIPGPGCPVCVCPEEDVYQAIQLALHEPIILVAFGDMLRVPVNVAKGEIRSLDEAKAAGADIRPIASPAEAVQIARENAGKTVVFFAAGFETTTAPVAAMLAEGVPENLSVLLSGRLTWPAVAMLLDSELPGFDALVAPGHVATVMGPEEWQFVVEKHKMPAAVAGFSPESLLAAMYSVLRQLLEGERFLDNCYPEVVRTGGNPVAQRFFAHTMDIVDANWRGVGVIPHSGFELNALFQARNARLQFPSYEDVSRKRAGQMPPGCDCAKVVLGKIYPNQCRIYGKACTPRSPVGPCMVSDEGACRIWWSSGVREAQKAVLT
ncbi:hydrogenase formation protein HypD [Sulfurirhabdus autotrophica]|uniref:Hydrogenase maturation factor n=1 Tax=Sulfurirhabdus autotrophica TaxID=1706046 RepID=A0A4R3XVL3_9PROT|nr:hydrogenase formation protein HypD [Sulfurirhabdus autotrophica]TCV80103.1 hydrogenase expression/formation protein HypD [Sulfurirhabdus autotrophica]